MNPWKYNAESTLMLSSLIVDKLDIDPEDLYKEVKGFKTRIEKKNHTYPIVGVISLNNGDEFIVELTYSKPPAYYTLIL